MATLNTFSPAWLQDPVEHLYRVAVLPVSGSEFDVVPVSRLDMTFDMDWSPMAQVSMDIITPDTATRRAALDSRLGTRVRLELGYRRQGVTYWGDPITLRLHRANTPHPGAVTALTAHGAEMILQDVGQPREEQWDTGFQDQYPDRSGADPFIRSWINRAWLPGPGPAIVSTIPGGTWRQDLTAGYIHGGGSNWSAIEGVAAAAGLRVYDLGDGVFHIDPLPQLNAYIHAKYTDGPGGTITSADPEVDREVWANKVTINFTWPTPPDEPVQGPSGTNSVHGTARVLDGPFRAVAPNVREHREDRNHYATLDYANAVAAAKLRKLSARGRSFSFTAIADYRLRPGATIQARTGTAAYETYLVAAVTLSPLTGSMAVTTIRPEDYEIGV